jgi:hypothetical protein
MSKLNPQKASAYVGPGVLKRGGNITPVPNGPLIKKKGPFKGSTLKSGGVIKKAQNGVKATKDSTAYFSNKATNLISNTIRKDKNSAIRKGSKNAMTDPTVKQDYKDLASANENRDRQKLKGKPGYDANGFPKKKAGGMIKRADGSTSQRGLWDNIRKNKGSGKKPTAAMLKQERKIKAKK